MTPDLAGFVREVLEGYWCSTFEVPRNEPDGGDIQELGVKYGLLVPRTATEPCGEHCTCAEWDNFPLECHSIHPVVYGRAEIVARLEADLAAEREARGKAERNEAACRAALEEVGYTGALPEGAYDKMVRERDEALAELAGLGPVELEASVGEGWGACAESTFNRLSEKGWKKRRIRVVQEHSNA